MIVSMFTFFIILQLCIIIDHYLFLAFPKVHREVRWFFCKLFFRLQFFFIFNPLFCFSLVLFILNLFLGFFGIGFEVAYAQDQDQAPAADLSNSTNEVNYNKAKSDSFIKTSEDFNNLLRNYPQIKDTIDSKFSEQAAIFEKFRNNLIPYHRLPWFFEMYSNTEGFRAGSTLIIKKAYFETIILSDYILRDIYEDIIPIEVRAEIFFWKLNKGFCELFQSEDFAEYISSLNLNSEDHKNLLAYIDELSRASRLDEDLLTFMQSKENFDAYVNSLPESLHAEVWALKRLKSFEDLFLKDPKFFSIFKDYINFDRVENLGQYKILEIENISVLSPKEVFSRISFGKTMEAYNVFFPLELRILILNCQELFNLRIYCLLHPEQVESLRGEFPNEIFEKLLDGRINYVHTPAATIEPNVCRTGSCPVPMKMDNVPVVGEVCPVPMKMDNVPVVGEVCPVPMKMDNVKNVEDQ